MEAALTLPFGAVRIVGGRLHVDGLVVDDLAAVRLVDERARAGEDASRVVANAIEIGARVLEREQVGANVEFVKTEFERAARELDGEFVERARLVADRLDAKVEELFGPDNGHLQQALTRHFSDDSAQAVQNRVRAVLVEAMARSREDLLRQFSSADQNNPLADFKRMSQAMFRQAADRQEAQLREMTERLTLLQLEVERLRGEREKLQEVAAVADKGTAKGRTYEEQVFEAIDAIAHAHGDDADAVGDLRGVGGKRGDVVSAIDACAGPSRGRIVFEAKNSRLSKNAALAELDDALRVRSADYAVLVVPGDEKLPARTHPLREMDGDKLFVVYDPEEGSRLALEVAYSLARARVLMARGAADGLDVDALRAELERAQGAMEDVRRIKAQLTNASGGIEEARRILEGMAAGVRGHLEQIALLVSAAEGPAQDG
jgi:FtsZ-binding cell division protein ZapB